MEKRKIARRQTNGTGKQQPAVRALEANSQIALTDVAAPAEDIDGVMSVLEEMDVEAADVLEDDNTISIDIPKQEEEEWEEEIVTLEQPQAADTSDPVRMYLQEMGNIPLLSREEEVAIAKEIEAGEKLIRKEVFSSPLAVRYVVSLGEKLKQEEIEPRYIFGDDEEESEANGKEDLRVEIFLSKMSGLKTDIRRDREK